MGRAWEMRAELKQKRVVPAHIVSTQLHPGSVLWSNLEKVVYFVELPGPWEDRVEEACDLKKARYSEMKLHGEAGVLA